MPSPRENARASLRLLLAEDNPVNQKIARRVLEKAGYAIDVVADGAEAVDAVRSERYALVLMDCHMPLVDGMEATRRIRSLEPPMRDVPIIAMTASLHENGRNVCVAAGMNDSISKPIQDRDLIAVIERWIRTPQAEAIAQVPAALPGDPAPARNDASGV